MPFQFLRRTNICRPIQYFTVTLPLTNVTSSLIKNVAAMESEKMFRQFPQEIWTMNTHRIEK